MSQKKIFVAGHNGMVGSAILRFLKTQNNIKILTSDRNDLDLLNQADVLSFLDTKKPDYIIIAAAKVGGIYANNEYPADFIYENLAIQCNLIKGAYDAGIKNLLFLGSSCIYPKNSEQPIKEKNLLSGSLELTNEPYAIAKIAGIKLCESFNRQFGCDYRCLMPTNLYGIGDNYHDKNSHVIPALIRRIAHAKKHNLPQVTIWGTGKPKREFLFSEDLASACYFFMNLPKKQIRNAVPDQRSHFNVGFGQDISISSLVLLISKVIGYSGSIQYDISKPDGTMKKLLDSSLINELGWKPSTNLKSGLELTYQNFKEKYWHEL